MMDHARHLSSPSPTSPFLFHHSERSFKSNPLTPLLSSTADVTSVDDCFSTSSSSVSHQSHNPFVVGGVVDHNHHHHHNHQHSSLVDSHHNHHATSHHNQNHHHTNHHNQNHNSSSSHHQPNHHSQRHHHSDVIDQDSLTGVDDDGGMHNMLSGSSTSSTSTMPLLTESHSHHSFSRISLEEYSPLSLVEDCDNALPISPTSLACGSHHSFKSSLNGLSKMDNLVGDVHDDDDEDHHNRHHHDPDDDDVNDARSLSPSLLSASNNNHHNLWSTASSTAISQNTSLLSSTSTSFLLSQHHQQQLNSLIQQLEPQSLDEPPPLLGGQASSGYDPNNPSGNSYNNLNRPSSEPPPGCGLDSQDVGESKSLNSQPLHPTSKGKQSNSSKQSGKTDTSATPSRPRRSRNRSSSGVNTANSAKQTYNFNISTKASISSNQQEKKALGDASAGPSSTLNDNKQPVHCSKLHLQLNHHEKLQELQKRLFGTSVQVIEETTAASEESNKDPINTVNASASVKQQSDNNDCLVTGLAKEEPDSSAGHKQEDATTSSSSASMSTTTTTDAVIQTPSKTTNTTTTPSSVQTVNKTRSRPTRSRRSKAAAAAKNNSESCNPSSSTNQSSGLSKGVQKTVTTETAEPDTTTKSSDCIKLADLLSNYNDSKSGTTGFILNGFASTSETNGDDNGEKRVQQIQVQVSPSLTVLTNGGIVQPFNIQQQQQGSGAVITTSAANFANQILCRPQTVVTTATGQLKGIMSNNELLKSGETGLSNWSFQSNSGNNNNNSGNNQSGTSLTNGQTIGAHQIAIQVICQDGTSLVLPVSSSAGLNAAVSLSSQHQQLQAVLANNANQQQQQRNSNQLLPLMSVSNIVAQQQVNGISEGGNGASNPSNQSSSTTTTNQQSSSGLAASSPTLAALLDAGSNRNNNDLSNNSNFSSQNFASTNLLRKLVSGNSNELKRGEQPQQQQQLTLQQGPTLNLANCGSLVTVCSAAPSITANSNLSSQQQANADKSSNGFGEKRIKLENADVNSLQTTFTLIDPQGLIVANGNESKQVKQTNSTTSSNNGSSSVTIVQQQNMTTPSATAAVAIGVPVAKTTTTNSNLPADATKQLSKLGSSTGNRPVDPTQPFRCEHCNSTFTRLGNFTRHKKIHTVPTKDGQRFKCDVCSKSFLQRCDLARHLHIHRGTEPHRCNICGKGYIRHSDLVTHQRFHNKEKPFGCPHCSKGFCQRGDLNRHLRSIHLQMKPILCPCCNRKFAKQETLLRHLNTAHRGKPGTTTTAIATTTSPSLTTTTASAAITAVAPAATANAIITELRPNYTPTQGDDKQTTISVVTNAAVSNNNNISQKNPQVASLQAIQATFCKVPQSVDPSTTSGLKAATSPSEQETVGTNNNNTSTNTSSNAISTKNVAS